MVSPRSNALIAMPLLRFVYALTFCFSASACFAQANQSRPAHSETPASVEAELQSRISSLIEQLADSNYHQRVNAKWELERIGLAAFEQLQLAAHSHPSVQIARAARYLIESQNVIWWLETDSLEVRELLKNYNDAKEDDKDTALQQLAERGTPDALLALCRMARFESSDLRSKLAALYLMEQIAKQMPDGSADSKAAIDASLAPSLRLTLGDSQRPSATWLYTLLDDLESASKTFGGKSNLEAWRMLLGSEHAASATSGEKSDELARRAALNVTMRFYRFLGTWITSHYSRQDAIKLVKPSLELIGKHAYAMQTFAAWALEATLPELVPELAKVYPDEFSNEAQLGYFLAESHLRLNDATAAENAAETASASVAKQLEKLKRLPSVDLSEIQASRHHKMARELAQRGLNHWAEKEYLRAIAFKPRIEASIRGDLAQFYWFGDEFEKAAAVLQPLAEEETAKKDVELPNAPGVFDNPNSIIANFNFYSGLAAIERNAKAQASEFLNKALEVETIAPNPDVVIAMKRLADEEPFKTYFESSFKQMASDFRIGVLQAEQELSRATDRMTRAMAAPRLAEECNQLAWLLSKCDSSPKEAISLSQRSLELSPDEPVYLDTLARCYFSAGNVQEAIRVQKRALKFAPHERQMAAQLREFEAAAAKASE